MRFQVETVIARSEATWRSRNRRAPCVPLDCFASLAMTVLVGPDCITRPEGRETNRPAQTKGKPLANRDLCALRGGCGEQVLDEWEKRK